MKNYNTITVDVLYPLTEQGNLELSSRVADVHARMIESIVQRMNCPSKQKKELLANVISTISGKFAAVQ